MVQVLPKHQGWFPDSSLMIKEYDAGTLLLLTKLGARNLMLYTIANIPLGGHDTLIPHAMEPNQQDNVHLRLSSKQLDPDPLHCNGHGNKSNNGG